MGIRCLNANHPSFQLEVQLELELESKLEHTLLSNQTERRWRAMTNGKLKLYRYEGGMSVSVVKYGAPNALRLVWTGGCFAKWALAKYL